MDTRDKESYERTYNTGCVYDSVRNRAAEEEDPNSAENAAMECWEDEEEVGYVKVQLGYVMQHQGREEAIITPFWSY